MGRHVLIAGTLAPVYFDILRALSAPGWHAAAETASMVWGHPKNAHGMRTQQLDSRRGQWQNMGAKLNALHTLGLVDRGDRTGATLWRINARGQETLRTRR